MRKTMDFCAILLMAFLCLSKRASAQDSASLYSKVLSFPNNLFSAINKKASSVGNKLDKQTHKYLAKLQKQETKLKKKLAKKDSILNKEIFPDIEGQYTRLMQVPQQVSQYSNVYSKTIDSISTALRFLKVNTVAKLDNNHQIEKALSHYQGVQKKLDQADQIKRYLNDREQFLKAQFQRLGMSRELKYFKKQIYYYQAQVKEYKAMIDDPSKVEAKLLEGLAKVPQFRDFFARYSQLGQLFTQPAYNESATVMLQGLQTRASVQQQLQDRFGSNSQVKQALQQNVNSAQSQLAALKEKVNQYASGGYGNGMSSDDPLPDFKPNSQKTKSLFNRLEWGSNVQTVKGNRYFPVTSDVALSIGYKLSDKSSIGIGAAYKMGLGSNWDHIRITHQGVGLRSYLDFKLKGSFYISGGYEQNYRSTFQDIEQLKDYTAWQASGLIGLSKKYNISKKIKGDMKLLWDFLSYKQLPRMQSLLFRVGYNFK